MTRLAAARRAGDFIAAAAAAARAEALISTVPGGTLARNRKIRARVLDAQLGYSRGDHARGRTSLASALRLAEPEQLRLPFVIERGWIWPVLRRDPELAHAHRCVLTPALSHHHRPAPQGAQDQAPLLIPEPLTEREQEVLRHASALLSTAEIASEMYISVNTLKTHLNCVSPRAGGLILTPPAAPVRGTG